VVCNPDGFVRQPARLCCQTIFSMLNDADLFIHNLAGQLLWQLVLGVIYLGWLASWWFRQQSFNSHVQTGS
jgi:hypothetical protein